MKKLITIFTLVIVVLLSFSGIVCAKFDPINDPNSQEPNPDGAIQNKVSDIAGVALGAIQNIGIVVGVLSLTIAGIRFMIGSAEEKAQYKEFAVPFVIGAILLMTVPTVLNIIYGFMKE